MKRSQCPLCHDFGTVDHKGLSEWCTCPESLELRRRHPDLVDRRNRLIRRNRPQLRSDFTPITQADVEAAVRHNRESEKDHERLPSLH